MEDLEIIREIEKVIGKEIPIANDFIATQNGYKYEEGIVTLLTIYECSIIPFDLVCSLKSLKFLGLKANGIANISPISRLHELQVLNLRENKIINLEPLRYLDKLETLSLSKNQIVDVEPISSLINLTALFLDENEISNIFPLSSLRQLRRLHLSNNQLSDIGPISELKKLSNLSLSRNNISNLSPLIELFENGLDIELSLDDGDGAIGIVVGKNPLVSPPIEIVAQGREAISHWFESGALTSINEVKLLLVGHGEVGKTTLVKCLRGEEPNIKEEPTHRILISTLIVNHRLVGRQYKNVKLKFWDFGGQEVMHSTHQFFLSQRSIYIVVLDGRRNEDPEYWLKHIESFGGNSPTLVVLNKIDTNPSYDLNRQFLLNKYPFIFGFYKTNCMGNEGLEELKSALISALDHVPILTQEWPLTWIKVKKKIESMKDEHISQEMFDIICDAAGIKADAYETLAQFLNDIGVVVHFKELRLKHLYVLQPQWAASAAYKIITAKIVSDNKGLLREEWLDEIMVVKIKEDYKYQSKSYPYILELLEKFELCYRVRDKNEYLIPNLLGIQQPILPILEGDVLKFYFKFEDLLPSSILPRFIVRMHDDIYENLQWRTGVVMKDTLSDAIAVIISDSSERRIDISVSGTRRREYFSIIRRNFSDLYRTFEKLELGEWIPLPDEQNFAIEYAELVGYEETDRGKFFVGKLKKMYKVKELLNGIENEKTRKGRYDWEVFLCHSSLDKPQLKDIISDLERKKISYWFDDEQIQPGDNFHEKIENGLLYSRNIMPCISANQLKSGWSRKEYQAIFNRVMSGTTKQRVIPFVLDDTPDEEIPLFLSTNRRERYKNEHEYQRLLEFLARKGR